MGNKVESWMVEIQKNNEKWIDNSQNENKVVTSTLDLFNSNMKNKRYGLKKMVIKKMFALFYSKSQ